MDTLRKNKDGIFSIILASSTFIVLIGTSSIQAASFQGIGQLSPNSWSYVASVSGDGSIVVGSSFDSDGIRKAVLWNHNTGLVNLGTLYEPDYDSWAASVSYNGNHIVGWSRNTDEDIRGFLWTASSGMQELTGLSEGGINSTGQSISGDGSLIVGNSQGTADNEATYWTSPSSITSLGLMSAEHTQSTAFGISHDGSLIVGYSGTGTHAVRDPGDQAFLWSESTGYQSLGDLPGGIDSAFAREISGNGQWVVGSGSSTNGEEAFRWSSETGMVPLGSLTDPFTRSRGLDVSDAGVVVGMAAVPVNENPLHLEDGEAFLWTEELGMVSLEDYLTDEYGLADQLEGWSLRGASGLSADGTVIVGFGQNPLGESEGWIAVIPEPTTLCFLSIGGLIMIRRKRYREIRK